MIFDIRKENVKKLVKQIKLLIYHDGWKGTSTEESGALLTSRTLRRDCRRYLDLRSYLKYQLASPEGEKRQSYETGQE